MQTVQINLQLYPVYLLWNRRKTLTGSPDPMRMQMVQINLQLYPVYLLWNRRKTLTGSPDPTHTEGTNKPSIASSVFVVYKRKTLTGSPDPTRMQMVQINLQLYPVYLLWNRRKTLTGSLDPTRANSTDKPSIVSSVFVVGIDVRPSQDHQILRVQMVQINLQLHPVYALCTDIRSSQVHRILRMQTVQINLQLYPVYLLCNRRKTLTGSLDSTHANGWYK